MAVQKEQVVQEEQLLIRFRGICALVNMPEPGKKRAILIRHQRDNSRIEHHIAYVEFYADDVESFSPELKPRRYTRPGGEGTFARVDLEAPTQIRLRGLVAGDVKEELSYKNDIPHMREILPEEHKVADSLLAESVKDGGRGRVAAVFDMPAGRIFAGEPEATLTRFPKRVSFTPRRLARWTDLQTTFKTPLTLELAPLGSEGLVRTIVFKESIRMLTIGNEPERLILGVMRPGTDLTGHGVGHPLAHDPNASPVQPTGHFILYYDILETPPEPEQRPVPIPTQIEGPGCPNNAYP